VIAAGFGLVNLVVEHQFTPDKSVVSRLYLVPASLRRIGLKQADRGHRACVYEGVERSALVQLQGDHRVERFTGWVAADLAPQDLWPDLIEHSGEGKYLGNRLYGEGVIGVPYLGMGAITEHDADAEKVGWHGGQVGNIAGIFAVLIAGKPQQCFVQRLFHRAVDG